MSKMLSEIKKTDAIFLLENTIKNGNKVIVFDVDDKEVLSLLYESLQKNKMMNIEVWHCNDESIKDKRIRIISKQEINEIMYLYHLYDFSDKIIVISSSDQYASMYNYIKTGILTRQEMVDALLYKL